jgi:nickel superoxide dismutase
VIIFSLVFNLKNKITSLSEKSDPLSNNQLNRWVMTKEQHAGNIQIIVSEYFLTQRVKTDKSQKYIDQTTTLHQVLVAAMKCKQTVDKSHVNKGI